MFLNARWILSFLPDSMLGLLVSRLQFKIMDLYPLWGLSSRHILCISLHRNLPTCCSLQLRNRRKFKIGGVQAYLLIIATCIKSPLCIQKHGVILSKHSLHNLNVSNKSLYPEERKLMISLSIWIFRSSWLMKSLTVVTCQSIRPLKRALSCRLFWGGWPSK